MLSKQVAEARGESLLTWYSLYKVDGGNMAICRRCGLLAGYEEDVAGTQNCPRCFSNTVASKPYALDLNLAGELLDEINHTLYWELSPCYREGVIWFRASAYDIHGDIDYNFEGVGSTKAIAICKLYLVFKGKTIKVEGGN